MVAYYLHTDKNTIAFSYHRQLDPPIISWVLHTVILPQPASIVFNWSVNPQQSLSRVLVLESPYLCTASHSTSIIKHLIETAIKNPCRPRVLWRWSTLKRPTNRHVLANYIFFTVLPGEEKLLPQQQQRVHSKLVNILIVLSVALIIIVLFILWEFNKHLNWHNVTYSTEYLAHFAVRG